MSQIALNSRLRLEMAAEGSHVYPCAEPRQLCAGVARRRHKRGGRRRDHMAKTRVSPGCAIDRVRVHGLSHGALLRANRARQQGCWRWRAAMRYGVRGERAAGVRGHRRSPNIGYRCVPPACPCLPVPPLASLTHLRVVQSTLGQRSRPTRTRTPRPSVIAYRATVVKAVKNYPNL